MSSSIINTDNKIYTMGEISAKYNMPASTLRYYEELGLLVNVKRVNNKNRVYTDEHIKRLDGIVCFKRTGMSILKIKEFYDYEQNLCGNLDNIIELVSDHEKEILCKIEELQADLEHIRHKVKYYNAVKQSYEKGEPIPNYDDIC